MPLVKVWFGFSEAGCHGGKILTSRSSTLVHHVRVTQKIDSALNMFGPDIEVFLTEMMAELDQIVHACSLGVSREIFLIVGTIIIQTVNEMVNR